MQIIEYQIWKQSFLVTTFKKINLWEYNASIFSIYKFSGYMGRKIVAFNFYKHKKYIYINLDIPQF